jgi:hypothetical protein
VCYLNAGRLIPGSIRTVASLKTRHNQRKLNETNQILAGQAPHKYPIAMHRMVAEIMHGMPNGKVSLQLTAIKFMRWWHVRPDYTRHCTVQHLHVLVCVLQIARCPATQTLHTT